MKKHIRSQSKPMPVTFQIQSLSHEGRGVALYDTQDSLKQGKKVFIHNALPDEIVRAQITRSHKRFEEADAIAVLSKPSPDRVDPICHHYGQCGGCSMQHIQKQRQIEIKQQVLQSHLNHFAGLTPERWLEPIRTSSTHYRRRARLGVRWLPRERKMIIGFREAKTNHVIALSDCPILDQRFASRLSDLYACFERLENKQAISHIEFAAGDEELALLVRHVQVLSSQDVDILLEFVSKHGWQLYLVADFMQSIQRIDQENATMRLHYALPDYDLKLAFSPTDFTQVNAHVNQKMVHLACQLLKLQQGERVLDLFCGLGNFSFALARCVGEQGQVVAVEGVDEMVQRGQENAELNQIHNVDFYQQDLAQDFSDQIWAKQGFDAILIDPPRAGAEQVMHYILHFKAKRIVYVSCDPATLARDAGILAKQGYRLSQAGVMDMFPHTKHVESITLFEQVIV